MEGADSPQLTTPTAGAHRVGLTDTGLLALLAAAKLLIHFLCNGRYGYWIDELYFIACGEHLDWGYVDHPPLIAAVAALSRWLFGDALFAVRFFPAVAGAALVFLAGCLARAFGGGRSAQALAAVAVIVAPVYLGFQNLLTMNAFEPLFWTLCAYLVVRMIHEARPRWWLLFGLVAGTGMLNKHSAALFCGALFAGLMLTPERRIVFSRWLWIGGALAALIELPNVLWEAQRGWPTIELLHNAQLYQVKPVPPLGFIVDQILFLNPVTAFIWIPGLWFCLWRPEGRRFRCLAWTYLLLLAGFVLSNGKTYYLAPIYPILFAAGAVEVMRRTRNRLTVTRIAVLVACTAVSAPYALPILPIQAVPAYLHLTGIKVQPENRAVGEIPQLFADMFGWEDVVAAVAKTYAGLSPEERSRAAIWGGSYGDAAAVDLLGRAHHLPRAISGHQNYYLWGPGDASGDVMITIGIPGDRLRPWFDEVQLSTTVDCPYCMPDRMHIPIHVCRRLKVSMAEFWPKVKCWTCATPEFARVPASNVR